jgi:hypothetical protein
MTLKDAINEYDSDVIPRGQKEVNISKQMSIAFNNRSGLKASPLDSYGVKPSSKSLRAFSAE